jgi:hypothetical protein
VETIKNLTLVQWIGLLVGLNSLFMGATPQLTVLFGTVAVPYIVAVATLANGALGVFSMVVGGQKSQVNNVIADPQAQEALIRAFLSRKGVEHVEVNSQADPVLAKAAIDPTVDKIAPTPAAQAAVTRIATTVGACLLAIMLGSLWPAVAFAQVKLGPIGQKVQNDLATKTTKPATPKVATTDPISKFMNDLEKVQKDVVDGIIADITAADQDAATLSNPSDLNSFKDPISHACYPAQIKFLQSLPVATPTTGKFVIVQLFQKKRDFVAQLQAGLPIYLRLGCAPLLGDEITTLNKTLGLVGVQLGLNALVPGLGIAMPVLPGL